MTAEEKMPELPPKVREAISALSDAAEAHREACIKHAEVDRAGGLEGHRGGDRGGAQSRG